MKMFDKVAFIFPSFSNRRFGNSVRNGSPCFRHEDGVRRKFAFTLAEVLITLGIIGVVSVLTIPNIISNYQKKVYVTQLQKGYNQISNAVALLMVDEEVNNLNDTYLYCDDDVESSDVCLSRVGDFLKKYFKVSKDCGYGDNRYECGDFDNYKLLDKTIYGIPTNTYCVNINSGMTLCIVAPGYCPLAIYLDINGKKGPNTWGRDAFYFDVNFEGDIAESFSGYPYHMDNWPNDPERCLENESYNSGCFTKIINDGWKMDY